MTLFFVTEIQKIEKKKRTKYRYIMKVRNLHHEPYIFFFLLPARNKLVITPRNKIIVLFTSGGGKESLQIITFGKTFTNFWKLHEDISRFYVYIIIISTHVH